MLISLVSKSMSKSNPSKLSANQPVPEGFALAAESGDDLIIRYKHTGMGCMNIFLFVWLFGCFQGCVSLIRFLFGGVEVTSDNGEPMPILMLSVILVVFLMVGTLVGCWLVYIVFCRKTFRLGQSKLTIETKVLSLKWFRVFEKDSIERFVQVKDGGEGKDSFGSWGLKMEGEQEDILIFRQPYEKSHWLGQILAQWADVEFVEAPKTDFQPSRP